MKKNIANVIGLAILAIVFVFNLNLSINNKTNKNDCAIQNIKALELSAVSAGCDPTTQNECSLITKDLTIKGVGQPFIQF